MLCQNCKQNIATVRIKKIINGQASEIYLCNACAGESTYMGPFNVMDDINIIAGLLGPFVQTPAQSKIPDITCENCKMTLKRLVEDGKPGCPLCYEVFDDTLGLAIRSIYGENIHRGKIPKNFGGHKKPVSNIDDLKLKLRRFVENQEYEQAAIIRDEIKKLSKGGASDEQKMV